MVGNKRINKLLLSRYNQRLFYFRWIWVLFFSRNISVPSEKFVNLWIVWIVTYSADNLNFAISQTFDTSLWKAPEVCDRQKRLVLVSLSFLSLWQVCDRVCETLECRCLLMILDFSNTLSQFHKVLEQKTKRERRNERTGRKGFVRNVSIFYRDGKSGTASHLAAPLRQCKLCKKNKALSLEWRIVAVFVISSAGWLAVGSGIAADINHVLDVS